MNTWIIFEIQTDRDGKVAHLPPVNKDEENAAWGAYYSKLASAATSSVYIHTVMLCTVDGKLIQSRSFMHGEVSA